MLSFLLGLWARLPLGWVQALGTLLGWLAYALSPPYRAKLRAHAALAGVPAAVRRAAVGGAGQMSAEVPWLWYRRRPLGALVRWQGPPLVQQALAAGQPVLLLTPHLGAFEVAARAYAEAHGAQRPITVLYRPARQAWLADIQAHARSRPGLQVAPATLAGVRQMLRALRRGEVVGLLPDQVPPLGQGVWAPFHGRPAYTMTLAARLAQQTGAAVVLVWCERLPGGRGFVFHQGAPADDLAALAAQAGDEAAAAAVNRAMEALVAQGPAQYLWGYNRHKGPTPGDAG
jgi:KDO2-lipid IV(A) lauroyltransferase